MAAVMSALLLDTTSSGADDSFTGGGGGPDGGGNHSFGSDGVHSRAGSLSPGTHSSAATAAPSFIKTEGSLPEPTSAGGGGVEMCYGCGLPIADRYVLLVNAAAWHARCLRCSVCQAALDRHGSCYIRHDQVFCKTDYNRTFSTQCAKCSRPISASDWVRRARESVFHLACFSCDACKRQLSTGEEFALQDSRVLCKTHYIEVIEGGPSSDSDSSSAKPKTKRVRTTFTDEQIQVLQANFQLDSNPDGQDLERIASITGLTKRVTQVWFQNSRARQKKHQQAHQNGRSGGGGGSGGLMSPGINGGQHMMTAGLNNNNNDISPPHTMNSTPDSCNGNSWVSSLTSGDLSFTS